MSESTEPRWSGIVPAALLAACLLSIASGSAVLPAAWRFFSLTAGSAASGSTAAALSIGLGAIAGALLAAKRAGRMVGGGAAGKVTWRRLVLLQAGLVLALAISPFLFRIVRVAYLVVAPSILGSAPGLLGARAVLGAALFLLPAAILAALVVDFGQLFRLGEDDETTGPGFALGFAAAGLALGFVFGGGVLLPVLGLRGTLCMALALSGFGAAGTLLLTRWLRAEGGAEAPGPAGAATLAGWSGRNAPALLIGFGLWCGFVCWHRTLQMLLGPTGQTLTIAASVLFVGLALGALVLAGIGGATKSSVILGLTTASALLVYGSMFAAPSLAVLYLRLAPGYASGRLTALLPAGIGVALILPAAVAAGGALASLGGVGTMPAVLLGALLAAWVTPLSLIPGFGLRRTLSLAAAVIVLGAVFVAASALVRNAAARATLTLALLAIMVVIGGFPASWDPRVMSAGLYRYAPRAPERFGSSEEYLNSRLRGSPPLFYREGRDASVVVEESIQTAPGLPRLETVILTVDGKTTAGTGTDLRAQILTGEIPILLHGPTESVLLIDFQSGVTAGSILRNPVRSLTVIEREPAVIAAGPLFIEEANNPLGDTRLTVVSDSPRARIAADPATYDAIVLAGTEPWLDHTAALQSQEGYDLLRRRLRTGGLVAQRVSLATCPAGALRILMRTFTRVFPSTFVFQLTTEDLLLIGTEAGAPIDASNLRTGPATNGAVADDLSRAILPGSNELVMSFRIGGDTLGRLMGEGSVNDDDRSSVQVLAGRDLTVHRDDGVLKEIGGAWAGFGPLLESDHTASKDKAEFLYSLAKSLLGLASDPERALDVARTLAGMGETAKSRWVTGEARLQQKDVDGAIKEWDSVLAIEPNNLDALFSLGTYYLDHFDYALADRYLAQAVRGYPKTAVVRYHYGRALFYRSQYARAIDELRQAQSLSLSGESYPLVDYLVGLSASQLRRDAVAAQSLQDYLKWAYAQSTLTRVEVDAHLKLAEVLDRQGKRFDALKERGKAEQLLRRIQEYNRAQKQPAAVAPGGAPAPVRP